MDAVFFAFDVVEIVRGREQLIRRAAAIHFELDRRLELDWLRDRILALPRATRWQTLARAALRDDLYEMHRALTSVVLAASSISAEDDRSTDPWNQGSAAAVERYLRILRDIRATQGDDVTTLSVAIRELANLIPSK
jgi:glutamate dehydrogenase